MQHSFTEFKAAAANSLRLAYAALDEEIADYPTPISGCDAQYTHLLAERRRLRDAQAALHAEIFIPTPRTLTPGSGVESR